MKQSTTPLPERPGTIWDMRHNQGRSWCANCGEDYNSHGAPEDVAAKHGVPKEQRHLICPASGEAWDAYRDAVRRESVDTFVAHFVSELEKLDATVREDATVRIVRVLLHDVSVLEALKKEDPVAYGKIVRLAART